MWHNLSMFLTEGKGSTVFFFLLFFPSFLFLSIFLFFSFLLFKDRERVVFFAHSEIGHGHKANIFVYSATRAAWGVPDFLTQIRLHFHWIAIEGVPWWNEGVVFLPTNDARSCLFFYFFV